MGISYSAVKTQVPEAWELGKDSFYYSFKDLFPASKMRETLADHVSFTLRVLRSVLPIQYYVGPGRFRVTDYYATADDLVNRIVELYQEQAGLREVDEDELQNYREFYAWAGSDEIHLIADFDYLNERDYEEAIANGEYVLCAPLRQYRHMDDWGGDPGREVGYDDESEDEVDEENAEA